MRRYGLMIIASIGFSSTASAIPLIYDFAGSGQLCTYLGSGSASSCATHEFSGTINMEVDPTAPRDIFYDPAGVPEVAGAFHGWVTSDLTIQWGASTFNASPFSGPGARGDHYSFIADVAPDSPYRTDALPDYAYTSERYSMPAGGGSASRGAALYRYTNDRTWITSLDWPLLERSPGVNRIGFWNQIQLPDGRGDYDTLGFYGDQILLSTLTLRNRAEVMALSVPEPATLGLLGLGLLGCAAVRRRRVSAVA